MAQTLSKWSEIRWLDKWCMPVWVTVCVWVSVYVCIPLHTHTHASNNKNKKLRELGCRGCVFLGGWVFELKVNTFRWRVMCSSLFLPPYIPLSFSLCFCMCVSVGAKVQFSITTVEFRILWQPTTFLGCFFCLFARQRVFNFAMIAFGNLQIDCNQYNYHESNWYFPLAKMWDKFGNEGKRNR